MDIVLIQPPRYEREASKRSQPPLGLAYIASFLEKQGLAVKVIDGLSRNLSTTEIVEETLAARPLAAGVTAVTEDRFQAIAICQEIKTRAKDILVIGGGPHFSYCAADALQNVPGLDVVVIGEGEFTTYDLLAHYQRYKNSHDFHLIDGCAFRDEKNTVMQTNSRTVMENLDNLPDPAWHLFDMNTYQGTLSVEEKTRAIGVISARGCPNRCVFCSNSLNRRLRMSSPARFVDQLQLLHEKYKFPGFNFQNDTFNANQNHAVSILQEILRRKMQIKWYGSLRVNNLSRELLELMREAGCVAISYGIESGSDRLLKIIKKGINTTQIRQAVTWASQVGFKHIALFMMESLPGETQEDIRAATPFINEMYKLIEGGPLSWTFIHGRPTLIYPGTEAELLAKKNGNVFPENFSWNTPYQTEKARVFNSNPYVPHFENPDFTLEDIAAYGRELLHDLQNNL